MIWSPLAIEVVLHCHTRGDAHPCVSIPVYRDTIEFFVRQGVLAPTNVADVWGTTAKGEAWVEMLGNTPLPQMKWVDRRFDAVDGTTAACSRGSTTVVHGETMREP